ncbi:hypothetical protein EI94DRAFT_120281 [Lactarius quietus]|nr:hypothetical protein EI94DRAFT_120281 [Lactarius quietus]
MRLSLPPFSSPPPQLSLPSLPPSVLSPSLIFLAKLQFASVHYRSLRTHLSKCHFPLALPNLPTYLGLTFDVSELEDDISDLPFWERMCCFHAGRRHCQRQCDAFLILSGTSTESSSRS